MSPKPNMETGMGHTLITEKYASFGTLMTTGNCNYLKKKKRKRVTNKPSWEFLPIPFRKGRINIRMIVLTL